MVEDFPDGVREIDPFLKVSIVDANEYITFIFVFFGSFILLLSIALITNVIIGQI